MGEFLISTGFLGLADGIAIVSLVLTAGFGIDSMISSRRLRALITAR